MAGTHNAEYWNKYKSVHELKLKEYHKQYYQENKKEILERMYNIRSTVIKETATEKISSGLYIVWHKVDDKRIDIGRLYWTPNDNFRWSCESGKFKTRKEAYNAMIEDFNGKTKQI